MSPSAGSHKLYSCENARCALGGPNPGYFTEGATREAMNIITGKPVEAMEEGVDYGNGVCPNCGEAAVDTETMHKSVGGDDG